MSVRLRDRLRTRGTAGGSGAVTSYLPGLAHWWKLEEASGSRADSIFGIAPLTQVGTVGSAAGKYGQAAFFNTDVDSNYLITSSTIPLAQDVAGGGPWTLSVWFRTPASSPGFSTVPLAMGPIASPESAVFFVQVPLAWDRFTIVGTGALGTNKADCLFTVQGTTWYLLTLHLHSNLRLTMNIWSGPGGRDVSATIPDPITLTVYNNLSLGASSAGTARAYNWLADNLLWWPGEFSDSFVRGYQGV